MDMTVDVEALDDWTVIRVTGELDVATAPRLREHVVSTVASGQRQLVLDLQGVEFVDSTGLGVVIGALKRTRAQGGDLRIVSTRPALRRLFELTALDRTLPLSDSVADAVTARAAED